MQPRPGALEDGSVHFTDGKCCTYHPALHNFLAGGVLLDLSPEQAKGRAALDALIDKRSGVSPLGVLGPRAYWTVYESAPAAFGRSRTMRCPLYLDGGCGVWRHREATCSTWFCKHDRGAVGLAFWRALHQLLLLLERQLSRHCLLELDVGSEALAALCPHPSSGSAALDPDDIDGGASDAQWTRSWGRWLGRERDFFHACARLAAGLSGEQLLSLAGAEARVALRLAREALQRLLASGPPLYPLKLGRIELVRAAGGVARVQTYREYDPLDVPQALLLALPRFDGRPTAQVLSEIEERDGLRLEPDLLRTLADFELLVPADATRK